MFLNKFFLFIYFKVCLVKIYKISIVFYLFSLETNAPVVNTNKANNSK